MSSWFVRAAAAAVALLALGAPAQALVVLNTYETRYSSGTAYFDEGYTHLTGPYGHASWYAGVPFSLDERISITNLRLLGIERQIGSYSWLILGKNGLYPDDPIYASAEGVVNTVVGAGGYANLWHIINLDVSGVVLDPGDYFVMFHEEGVTGRHQAIAQSSRGGRGAFGLTGGVFGANMAVSSFSGSFSVEILGDLAPAAVPEPTTLPLLAAGAAGLGALRRRGARG